MIRRWLFRGLVIGFVLLVVSNLGELKQLTQTVQNADWRWVLVAAGLEITFFLLYTLLFQSAFALVGVQSKIRNLLPLTFVAIFVNSSAPTGGAAGAALFADHAGRQGESPARAASGALLVLVADYSSFSLILLGGLISLFWYHSLYWYEIVSALVLFLFILGMSAILTLGLWRPLWLHQILAWIQTATNKMGGWFQHPALLAEGWSEKHAEELIASAQAMASNPRGLTLTLAIALIAHLFEVAALYALFQALNTPAEFGIVVAGYAMTILFWIVSPTPNGIGVVEGLMPVIYVSLGVPAAEAAVISLAFRGVSLWLPMVIGFVLLHRLDMFHQSERTVAKSSAVHLIAVIIAVMGIINVLSGVTPSLPSRVAQIANVSPLLVRQGGQLISVLAGFALLVLARGLWRRRRTAWTLTMGMLLFSVIVHLVKGLDYVEATLAFVLMIVIWTQRSYFHALSDPPSRRYGLTMVVTALLFTLSYGTLGFYLLEHHFDTTFGVQAALTQTIVLFTQFYDPAVQPYTGSGRYFVFSVYLVAATTFAFSLWLLLRPMLLHTTTNEGERRRAKAIVVAYGRSSLARFTLLPDKSYWFSPGGSVVAYAVRQRMAVALGDPIGPSVDACEAIAGFRRFCEEHGWLSAFYQTQPDYLTTYQTEGNQALCIGHEGIIDLQSFNLYGSSNKDLRSTVNRFNKRGYRTVLYEPPVSDTIVAELHIVSDEWLTTVHGREKRFSLGWFDEEYVRNSTVMAVHRPDDEVMAFATVVSEYQMNEVAIDLMRHRRDVDFGILDYLYVSLFQWARQQEFDTFNLGLSALSGVDDDSSDPATEGALHYIYAHVNQFYSFKALHEFKAKFQPRWSPRYLIYPNLARLPAVGYTLESAGFGPDLFVDHTFDALTKIRTLHKRRSRQTRIATAANESRILSDESSPQSHFE